MFSSLLVFGLGTQVMTCLYSCVWQSLIVSSTSRSHGQSAVLPAMERLPVQHGLLVQTPAYREELPGRDARLRGTDVQGAQDGPLRLLAVLQKPARGVYDDGREKMFVRLP